MTAATTNDTQITVTGTLNSTASSFFRIEFFASASADASGNGEGQRYLGYLNAATNGSGNATINTTLTASAAVGEYLSATATKSNAAYDTFTDTSEFAANVIVTATYYSKGSLAVDTPANWNSRRDGTGTNAPSFGTGGKWVIQNTHAMTLAGSTSWNVSSSGVVQIESGGTWTNSSSGTVTIGTFQVDNGGTYAHGTTAAFPGTTRTLGATSTVNYSGTAQTVTALSYGHLTLSNSGTKTFASGTTNIAGNMTISGTATGNATTNTATIDYNGAGAQNVGAMNYHNLTLSNAGVKTFASGTSGIASTFTISGSASANATTNSTTIDYNGAVDQAMLAMNYYNLTLSNAGIKTFAAGVTGIAGALTRIGAFYNITANVPTVDYNGGAQNVAPFSYWNLTISGSGNKTLSGDASISSTLTLTNGNVITGTYTLWLVESGTVSRTSGHVVGNFRKSIAIGATSKTFEIGDATNYTPVTVAFTSVTVAGDLIAKSTAGDHPNISSSTINAAKSVNRYWSLTNSGLTFTDYSATFTFVAGDVDGGANTSGFIVGKYGAGWTYPTVGTKTATTTQITGVTSFSDFQLGELAGNEIAGRVFEDVNYGGGAGRNWTTASGNGGSARSAARVELFDGAGAFVTSTTTDGSGNYTFTGVAAGNYTVRVVSSSVTSSGPATWPP